MPAALHAPKPVIVLTVGSLHINWYIWINEDCSRLFLVFYITFISFTALFFRSFWVWEFLPDLFSCVLIMIRKFMANQKFKKRNLTCKQGIQCTVNIEIFCILCGSFLEWWWLFKYWSTTIAFYSSHLESWFMAQLMTTAKMSTFAFCISLQCVYQT